MINFRYHIISLTAVLLALGVGLALGTAFLDEATVDVLRGQLDGLEADLDDTRAAAAELRSQLELLEQEHEALDEQLDGRLLDGYLPEEPVLVVTSSGGDGTAAERAVDAITETDAELIGVWRLTDRVALEDENAIDDLGSALDLTSVNANRLRRDLVVRLAEILDGATDPPSTAGATQGSGMLQQRFEPDLLERLHDNGFVDYDLPAGSDEDAIALPAGGTRIVVVTGTADDLHDELLLQLLNELASDGPVPVLIASPTPPTEEDEAAGDGTDPLPLLAQVREHDDLADRISTVDNLDRAAGKLALVLALEDAAPDAPRTGHYGSGERADHLLPPPEVDE
jgi:hypothetical protein